MKTEQKQKPRQFIPSYYTDNNLIPQKMLMIMYTNQQLDVIHDIRNGQNTLLSSPHGTGKSMIFSNLAIHPQDSYYSIGRTDYNLTDLCQQYQHEDITQTLQTRLFLDNVLVNDLNQFKYNYNNLQARLKNLHIIAYFKDPQSSARYFPSSARLTKYFGLPAQVILPNKKKGDYSCLSNIITEYDGDVQAPIYHALEGLHHFNRHDRILENTPEYDYKLEGKFPKQYYIGNKTQLCYASSIIIRVNDYNEPIDERLLKATKQLILLKRQSTPPREHPFILQQLENQNQKETTQKPQTANNNNY